MTLIIETSGDRAGIEHLWERYGSDPQSTEFMALAEQLRRRGCQGEAVNICARAKAAYPQYVSCRVLLGRCLMELGLEEQAFRELQEVLELDRENAFSLRAMAELRMSQGNLSEAANYYRALVRINPADLDMQEKLALVVRALEPADDVAGLPADRAAAARYPQVSGAQATGAQAQGADVEAGPSVISIERAVEIALEELRTPSNLVPSWHMEDRPAGSAPECRTADWVLTPRIVPAVPDQAQTQALAPVAVPSEAQSPAQPAQGVSAGEPRSASAGQARVASRKPGRPPVRFFNYANRQSDFSLFVKWVEQERRSPEVGRAQ